MGDYDQGEAYLERLLNAWGLTMPGPTVDYIGPAMVIPMISRITGLVERLDIAETTAQAIISSSPASSIIAMSARASLALLAVIRADVAVAEEQYVALESQRGTMFGAPAMFSAAPDHILALLSQTMQNIDQAVTHYEDALALCRKAGHRPELAWTYCDYADTLLERNEPGDREQAMSLLDESLAISSELGMRPLMERVLSRREILKA